MSDELFPDINFDEMNELDICEEILCPLLRHLGYRTGTENNILRERQIELRYPHIFLWWENPKKDPKFAGIPNYICEVRGYGRWMIEAKPPTQEIGQHDIEQAHSYSVHSEIRAPVFVVSNGRRFLILEANRGPNDAPLVDLGYEDLPGSLQLLEGILAPDSIRKRYSITPVDVGKPLAQGLGSFAKITGGTVRYDNVADLMDEVPPGIEIPDYANIQNLVGVNFYVAGNDCMRDENNGIVANIRIPQIRDKLKSIAEVLDMEVMPYRCSDSEISTDPEAPSIFEFEMNRVVPAGTEMFNVLTRKSVAAPMDVAIAVFGEATGHLDGQTFSGLFTSRQISECEIPVVGSSIRMWLFLRGVFCIEFEG